MSAVGPLCALLSSATWAVGTAVYARVAREVPGPAVNASRALVALPVFLTVLAVQHGPAGAAGVLAAVPVRALGLLGLSTLASYGVGDLLFMAAAARIGVPAALAIGSTYPLWAALAGAIVLGEPLSALRLCGAAAMVGGTVTVMLAGSHGRDERPMPGFGVGLMLACGTSLLWAVNGYGLRAVGSELPVTVTSTVRLAFGLAICPMIGWLLHRRGAATAFRPFVPWRTLRPFLWAFLLEAVAGTFFFVVGLARSPLAVGTALSSLAPVLSAPLAWALRTERPSVMKALGIGVVCLGTVLLVL